LFNTNIFKKFWPKKLKIEKNKRWKKILKENRLRKKSAKENPQKWNIKKNKEGSTATCPSPVFYHL